MSIANIAWGVISASNRTRFSTPIETDPYSDQVVYFSDYQSRVTSHDKTDAFNMASLYTTTYIEKGTGPFGDNCLVAGSGGYHMAAVNFAVGAADFTIEFWVKTTLTGFAGVASFEALPTDDFNLFTLTGDYVYASGNVSSWSIMSAVATTYGDGDWHHVALTRAGTAITAWVDGVAIATATVTTGAVLTQRSVWSIIGKKSDGLTGVYTSRIAHLRMTKEVCRYLTAFTPPAAAFPAPTMPAYPKARTARRYAIMAAPFSVQTLRRFTILTS